MLLQGQDVWSHSEVRKLIALIVTDQIRAQAAFDAVPLAIGVLATDLRVIWANDRLRRLLPNLQAANGDFGSITEAARRNGTPAVACVGDGSKSARLHVFPSSGIAGEIVVAEERSAEQGGASAFNFAALDFCGVAVVAYNRDGEILYANTLASEVTGYNPEALQSLRIGDLVPEHDESLLSPGEHVIILRRLTGLSDHLRVRVRAVRYDETDALCLTVLGREFDLGGYSANVAALEGCLTGAFPDSSISISVERDSRYRFHVVTNRQERVLTVTAAALRSERFRQYLRDVPEALNLTRTVLLTEEGVRVDE